MNVFLCQTREGKEGSFHSRGFPFEWLALSLSLSCELREKWEAGKSCNCCQSLLSAALKAAAFSQLRSERSLGCAASPPGLWRIG